MADRKALTATVIELASTARDTFEERFGHGRPPQTGDLRAMRVALEDIEDQAKLVHDRGRLAAAINSGAEDPDYLRSLIARAGIV